MTRQEAIDDAVIFAEKYVHQDNLNDAQAARIGRRLFANLRMAARDASKVAERQAYKEGRYAKTD